MNFSCPYFAHLYSYEFFVVTLLRKNQASFCFCVLCEQNFRSNGSNQFYDVQATKIWKSYNQKMFSKDRMIKFHAWKGPNFANFFPCKFVPPSVNYQRYTVNPGSPFVILLPLLWVYSCCGGWLAERMLAFWGWQSLLNNYLKNKESLLLGWVSRITILVGRYFNSA